MSQLSDYLLGQVLHNQQSIKSDLEEIKVTVDQTNSKLSDLITWGSRLAILVGSWVSAILLNAKPDDIGAAVAQVLKFFR